jgi:hypothetical protein
LPPALAVTPTPVAPAIPEARSRDVPVEESPVTDQRRAAQADAAPPQPREPRTAPRIAAPAPPPVEPRRAFVDEAHEHSRLEPRPEQAAEPIVPFPVEPRRARTAEAPAPRADAIRAEADSLIPPPEPSQHVVPEPAVRPVRVTIGAIEVRVSAPASAPPPETPSSPQPAIEGFEGLEQLRNYNYWGSR